MTRPAAPPPRRLPRIGFFGGVAAVCALASLAGPLTCSGWLMPDSAAGWWIGLASHHQWVYAGVAAVALLLALLFGPRLVALAAAGVVAFSFTQHAPLAPEAPPGTAADGPRFVVASANLNLHTTDFEPLRRWLLAGPVEQSPDVVFLQEFTPEAQLAVAAPGVLVRYPHQWRVPSRGPFGLAILSRHPLTDTARIEPTDAWLRLRLRAVVQWQGQAIALSAVHPMPPLRPPYAEARDRSLREEAAWLAQGGRPAVLAGDLNDTPWSSGVNAVQPQLRSAWGLRPTWPVSGWLPAVLPIDQVLVSDAFERVAAVRGPDLGSDHRPIRVELRLRKGR